MQYTMKKKDSEDRDSRTKTTQVNSELPGEVQTYGQDSMKYTDGGFADVLGKSVAQMSRDQERQDKAIKAITERLSNPDAKFFTGAQIRDLDNYRFRFGDEALVPLLDQITAKGGYSTTRSSEVQAELLDYLEDIQYGNQKWGKNAEMLYKRRYLDDDVRDSYVGMSDKELLAMVDRKVLNGENVAFLTAMQADVIKESGIWKKWTPEQLASYQIGQRYLQVDWDDYKEALERTLGRYVSYREMRLDKNGNQDLFDRLSVEVKEKVSSMRSVHTDKEIAKPEKRGNIGGFALHSSAIFDMESEQLSSEESRGMRL